MNRIPLRSGFQAVVRRGTSLRRSAAATAPPCSTTNTTTYAQNTNATMTKRWYRGDSGEMETTLSPKEQELLSVAQPRADAIYERHVRLPKLDKIPSHNLPDSAAASSKEEMELDVRRKRLVYRAKQRGWLEVDLLLGTWANQNVPKLGADELDQFESFVNLETIDIYNVITLRSDVPEEMRREGGAGVVEQIQKWARASPLGKAEPEKYASVKQDNNLI
eukprot:CAMPEP_0197725084 /NCGR_PEP_ID=MMETSP1434-20131217/6759_1 /TAXON_ID=265543 /ORGANISM="Minutocellus polymorphus, Strain CCMP3303" /LENGTH=219 /DNA_ID=CAMNT_0043310529 /DNA_START=39 /DNA_END=698 /DNA_ORIENTATION=+